MALLYLFFIVCFGTGAMTSGIYWSLIRSSYMERHRIPGWKYFFWKPYEFLIMLREERAYARMMFVGLAVAAFSISAMFLVRWLFGSEG